MNHFFPITTFSLADEYSLSRIEILTRNILRATLTRQIPKTGKPNTIIKNVVYLRGGTNTAFEADIFDNILYINADRLTTGSEIMSGVVPALTLVAANNDANLVFDIFAFANNYVHDFNINIVKQEKREFLVQVLRTQGYNDEHIREVISDHLIDSAIAADVMRNNISSNVNFWGIMDRECRSLRQRMRDAFERMLVPRTEVQAECERLVKQLHFALKPQE